MTDSTPARPADTGPPAAPGAGTADDWAAAGLPQAVVIRRAQVSIVWLIPAVALAIGAWLAYRTYAEQGPTVQIQFASAAGLAAGKTKVKFRDVDLGDVTAIDVSPDLKSILVTAQLRYGTAAYLTERTRFWVERPRVSRRRVSGLETLLSGPYIAIDPVTEGEPERHFIGLEEPPLFTTTEPGQRYRLRSPTLGSLNVGSPVYHRQVQVGQVVGYDLEADGKAVGIEIFISAPYDQYIHDSTRFWNASGLDFTISTAGLRVDSQSLLSVLVGGIAFDTPEAMEGEPSPVEPGEVLVLYPSREEAHARTYAHKERYLLYFKGSVNGLAVDAPVMLRGIRIGRVLNIRLVYSVDEVDFQIPVLVEVEPERIEIRGDPGRIDRDQVVERLVERGLRGQLRPVSLLTGALYVDMDFHPDAPPARLARQGDYLVLPTIPAPLEALTTRATSVLEKLDRMPIDQIGKDAAATIAGASALINSPQLKGAVTETRAALAAVRATAEHLDGPVAAELSAALRATATTMGYAGDIVSERSPFYIEMKRMMADIGAAARSLKNLTDYLERHPEALLKGKGGAR